MTDTRSEWYDFRNAVAERDFARAASLLERDPNLIRERSSIGESVIHFLAIENDEEGVSWLHERGADLNTVNDFGTPLIFEVAQLGYKSLLKWLIEHGADPKKKDSEGLSLEEYLKDNEKPEMVDYLNELT